MVNFTSIEFIFRFLPIFLIAYYFTPIKYKNLVMVIGSLIFYAFGEPIFVGLLIVLTLINHYLGHLCFINEGYENTEFRKKRQKLCLIFSLVLDIVVLIVFKILDTYVNRVLFPLGISFYIFKMISYQIDIYRNEVVMQPSLMDTAAYFTMFPQVIQGPIVRYEDSEIFNEKKMTLSSIEDGLRYFIVGFAMKVALADRIGILFNDLSMYGYQSISSPLAWLGAFAFSFELYFDFWGYSLMSSGILVALGYEFYENFDQPYSSKTISEFYRRWHITLGAFFRDYIYFPLGGSRGDTLRTTLNLMLVWAITGIWHGNGYNYLIWGVVLGSIIVLEKLFYGQKLQDLPVLGNVYVCIIIPLTWMIFAIEDINDLGIYFSRLFPIFKTPSDVIINHGDFMQYLGNYWYLFIIAIVLCIPKVTEIFRKYKKNIIVTILLFVLFWYSVYFSASKAVNPFMYLKF